MTDLQQETLAEIRRFLLLEVINDASLEISADAELIGEGLIDSMGIVRLLVHVQSKFGIPEIAYEDLVLDNFRTLSRIATLVVRYRIHQEVTAPEAAQTESRGTL